MTWILFAIPFESVRFASAIGNRGDVKIIHTGVGTESTQRALAEAWETSSERPKRIISCGFAGGLSEDLAAGDLVIAENFSAPEMVQRAHGSSFPAKPVPFISWDVMVSSPAEKRTLHNQTGAKAVDMESSAIAAFAQQHRIPMMVIRAISDPYDCGLVVPPTVLLAASDGGVRGTLDLLVWVALRPQLWRAFISFVRHSQLAQSSLATVARIV